MLTEDFVTSLMVDPCSSCSGRCPRVCRRLRVPAEHQADVPDVSTKESQRAQNQRGSPETHHVPHQVR